MGTEDSSFDNPTFTPGVGSQCNEGNDSEEVEIVKANEESTSNEAPTATTEKQPTAPCEKDMEAGMPASGSMRKTLHVLRNRRGFILAILAALFYSFKSMLIDYLTLTVDPFQAVVMIMPVMLLGSLSVLLVRRVPPPKTVQQYMWLLYGGCAMSAYLCSFSFSLTYIEVADAVTILYASLMFVGLLSWVILKEKPLVFDFLFAIVSFAGVICISKPHFIFGGGDVDAGERARELIIGVAFALGAAFCIALSYPIVRRQSQLGIHTFMTVFCSAIVGSMTNALICTALQRWRVPLLRECLFALGAGLSYFCAQSTLFYALSVETATLVNIAMTVEIVFTFVWQFLLLDVTPFWTSYLGSGLVMFACVGTTLKKRDTDSEH